MPFIVTNGPSGRVSRRHRASSLVDILMATMLLGFGTLVFAAIMPAMRQNARHTTEYAQAISAVQHKADQLRALGYGRLTFTEMRNAAVIDASPTSSPFRFEAIDSLSSAISSPVGTITLSSPITNVYRADISLSWKSSARITSNHAISILISKE
jgi:hypothetical protein